MLKNFPLYTVVGLMVVALTTNPGFAQKKKKNKSSGSLTVATSPLDEGRLDPSWFGGGMAFVQQEEIDYFWVKEGYDFSGKTFHFKQWPEPEKFLGEAGAERDENDFRLARQMAGDMHQSFADTFERNFGSDLPSSTKDGEIAVEGRIVDCSTGNTAAKMLVGFGAGSGNTTIDLKFTDKATGEVVAALHHRVVSGTSWSTTDSKFFKWVKKMGKEIVDDGWYGHYQGGRAANE
jgi:hypothetical protein